MCAVIDINSFVSVFVPESKSGNSLERLRDWIWTSRCGRVVYGGSDYSDELKESRRILDLLGELQRSNRTRKVDDETVDSKQKEVEQEVWDAGCDDPHIVALLITSGVRIICTFDKGLQTVVRRCPEIWRPHGVSRPRIYQRDQKHSGLLKDSYVAPICR